MWVGTISRTISFSTLSGKSRASRCATRAPLSWPIKKNVSCPNSEARQAISFAIVFLSKPERAFSESPYPLKSGIIRLNRFIKVGDTLCHICPVCGYPCSNTKVGPSPPVHTFIRIPLARTVERLIPAIKSAIASFLSKYKNNPAYPTDSKLAA